MGRAKIAYSVLFSFFFVMFSWAKSGAEEISWNGVYAGVHGGFAESDVGWDEMMKYFLPAVIGSGTSYWAQGSGFAGGVQIGINKQWSNGVVAGLEFSASGLNVRTSEPSPLFDVDTFKTSIDHLLLGSARIGYATGRFLFYADGGFAAGRVSIENSIEMPGYYYVFASEKWHPGYSLGSGFDYRATKNVSIGFNYRLVALQNKSHAGKGNAIPYEDPDSHLYTVDAQAHILSFRLNWLFNQD